MSRNYLPWNSQRKTYQLPGNKDTDLVNKQHPRISHTGAHCSSGVSFSWDIEGDPDSSGYFNEISLQSFSELHASGFFDKGSQWGDHLAPYWVT